MAGRTSDFSRDEPNRTLAPETPIIKARLIFIINEADYGEKSASSMTQGAARISAACSPLALLNRLPIAPEYMVSVRSVNAAVRFCRTSGPYLAWAAM